MKKKPKGSLFRMLVVSYIAFASMMLLSFVVILVVSAFALLGQSSQEGMDVFALANAPESSAATDMQSLGVWAEGLDANYAVIEIRGEKQDEAMQYTQSDIYRMMEPILASAAPKQGYQCFLQEATAGSDIAYWLVKMPTDTISLQATVSITNAGATQPYYYLVIVVLIAAFAANCVFLSLFLKRRIQKPLALVSAGMQQLQNGDEGVQLQFDTQMEFAEIRDSFNVMSKRLADETHARKEAEAKKNQLILDLSHDIKTPTATIKAYANALEAGLVKPEKQQEYYRTIDAKADRISGMINDLFTILSADNPAYPLRREPLDIVELTRELCAAAHAEVESKKLSLEVDFPDTKLFVSGESALLARVIDNLLSNAIKYNTTGTYIRVTIEAAKDVVRVKVADDGAPIDPEYSERIFDAFVRVDKARSSSEGTGLGLAISKKIVERHGGRLTYERQQNWNVFVAELPIA